MGLPQVTDIVINLDDPSVMERFQRGGGDKLVRVTVIQDGKRVVATLRGFVWSAHPTRANRGIVLETSVSGKSKDVTRDVYAKPWYAGDYCEKCGGSNPKGEMVKRNGVGRGVHIAEGVKARAEGVFRCEKCQASFDAVQAAIAVPGSIGYD